MNNDLSVIVKIFEKKIPRKVLTIYDGGNKYLVATESKSSNKFSNLDPYYTMNKNGKEIKGFNPASNPVWYNNALDNLVYGTEVEDDEDPLDMIKRMLGIEEE